VLGPGFQNEVKWRFGGAAKAAKASAVYNYLTQSFLSPACAPSAGPFRASDTGTQISDEAP